MLTGVRVRASQISRGFHGHKPLRDAIILSEPSRNAFQLKSSVELLAEVVETVMQPCLKLRGNYGVFQKDGLNFKDFKSTTCRKVEGRETQDTGKVEIWSDNVPHKHRNIETNPSLTQLAEQLQSPAACLPLVSPRTSTACVCDRAAADVPCLCPKLLPPAAFTSQQPCSPRKASFLP